MNAEIKQKWVEALRSGKYQQGRNRLKSGESYCCLGVLCDVLTKDGAISRRSWKDSKNLTHEAALAADLPIPEGAHVTFKGGNRSLVYLNDVVALSFPEIADIIEQQL